MPTSSKDGREPFPIKGCKVVRKGQKALLISHPKWKAALWIADAGIHDDSELYMASQVDEVGKLVLFRWFASARNLLRKHARDGE